MSEKVMEYFNKMPRLGTLSTANKAGKVDVAYFGSARMIDEKTIFMWGLTFFRSGHQWLKEKIFAYSGKGEWNED